MPNITVTLDNYVDLSGRTEAPICGLILSRVSDPKVIAALLDNLTQFAEVATRLDQIKKFLFYGKQLPASFFFPKSTGITPALLANLQDEQLLRLLHAVLGIATEAGELVSDDHKGTLVGVLPVLQGKVPVDAVNFLEEGGDLEWYVSQLLRVIAVMFPTLPVSLQRVLQTNVEKLYARYPEKFTAEEAINRDIDAERRVLETDDPGQGLADAAVEVERMCAQYRAENVAELPPITEPATIQTQPGV